MAEFMHLLRNMLALAALLALVGGGLHASAMAHAPAKPQIAMQADSAPCHESTAAKPASAKPAKADCCPDGCDGQCTVVGAFFADPALHVAAFFRAVPDAPAKARPASALAATSERPPKS